MGGEEETFISEHTGATTQFCHFCLGREACGDTIWGDPHI